ncbi:hypothetical protein J14TS2_15920 [Bacillus sp. J14TS2]|uniref:hypothetical protein n=1 Tax=Bacillus sp. J14TS2 TaxID=2807188 RepID=UPI001B22F326|nr:hypothetical protein [Bacillus sp. J14TS2]GIN71117.1 hypothetical protein J14TS2_15920 [Bacillus sp. J14TS2]
MEKQETRLVTRLEMFQSQQELKRDVTSKIEEVDGKVDYLNKIVLPLVESSKQTAKNTDRMAKSLDEFTAEQRKTNGKLYRKLSDHDIALTELGVSTKSQADVKKANATIIVAVIGAVSVLISGIFAIAPHLFK